MIMATPLVSICIPTYNRAKFVSKAIDSALSQSYQNIEILVVDNASHDEIESVIAHYQDPRLKFFKNSRNLGMYGNFNRCIELSKGKYIHILHSDDYIDAQFTGMCVEFMESHPNVMMTFSSAWFLSKGEQKKFTAATHDVIYPAPDGFRKILGTGNMIICPSVMMNRKVYDSLGLYSTEYPYAGDLNQWLKISRHFDFAFVAGATLFYREGEHSESFQLLFKTPLGYIDIIKIYMHLRDELGDDAAAYRRELNLAIRRHMRTCYSAGIWQRYARKSYSPLVFIGLSLNTWALIQPDSVIDSIKKFLDFLFILIIGFFYIFPGGLSVLKTYSWLKQRIFQLLK
jgi:glycosyltransferase involved in cell wall biosynthesis